MRKRRSSIDASGTRLRHLGRRKQGLVCEITHCNPLGAIIHTASVRWSVGYAMNNLDGVPCIHPSLGIHIYIPLLHFTAILLEEGGGGG